MAPRSVRFGMRSRNVSNVGQSLDGWPKIYYLELLRASEGTLSRWSRLHLQSLASTNSHWAPVVGYGLFFLFWFLLGETIIRNYFLIFNAFYLCSANKYGFIIIIISLLMSPLLGHRPPYWLPTRRTGHNVPHGPRIGRSILCLFQSLQFSQP
jgi:cellulose synthase/poly-beta-1,6-N-acetylglucosamine synthase-like glycosyltransferase